MQQECEYYKTDRPHGILSHFELYNALLNTACIQCSGKMLYLVGCGSTTRSCSAPQQVSERFEVLF